MQPSTATPLICVLLSGFALSLLVHGEQMLSLPLPPSLPYQPPPLGADGAVSRETTDRWHDGSVP